MRKSSLKIFLILIALFFNNLCRAQAVDLNTERIKIKSISTQIDSLSGVKNILSDSADLLSIKIKSLTSREPGRKEHNQLEKLLRKSHQLTIREEKVNNKIKLLSGRLVRDRGILAALLQSSINLLMKKTEEAAPQNKAKITEQISSLLAEKHALNSSYFKTDFRKLQEIKISPRPWDSPAALRLKSSMLLDRSDKLKNQAEDITRLIREFENERKVRERISELNKDLALFNENEERILTGSGKISPETSSLDSYENNIKSREASAVKINEDSPLPFSSIPSSPVELKTFIKEMKLYVKRISEVSDSLQQSADNFEKLAVFRETHE